MKTHIYLITLFVLINLSLQAGIKINPESIYGKMQVSSIADVKSKQLAQRKLFQLKAQETKAINELEKMKKAELSKQHLQREKEQGILINQQMNQKPKKVEKSYFTYEQMKTRKLDLNIEDINFDDPQIDKILSFQFHLNGTRWRTPSKSLIEEEQAICDKYNIPGPFQDKENQKYGFQLMRFKDQKQKEYVLSKYKPSIQDRNQFIQTMKHGEHSKFRFIQNKMRTSPDPISSKENQITIKNCWASSRQDEESGNWIDEETKQMNKKIKKAEYPCESAYWPYGKETGKWRTNELQKANEDNIIIDFRASFKEVYRISQFIINWWVSPYYMAFDISLDGEIWQPIIPMTITEKLDADFKDEDLKNQVEYSLDILFDEPLWFKSFKIKMKQPMKGNWIGIRTIRPIFTPLTVQFTQYMYPTQCLVNVNMLQDEYAGLMNCENALALADGREIFVFDYEKTISSYSRPDSCLSYKKGKTEIGTQMIISSCTQEDKGLAIEPLFFHANHDKKFLLTPKTNQLVAFMNQQDLKWENVALLAVPEASEHADNPVNTPDKLNDGTEKAWISAGSSKVEVSLELPQLEVVNNLRIVWKFPPKAFKVEFHKADGVIDLVHKESDNHNDELDITFIHTYVQKVVVKLLEYLPPNDSYGIEEIYLNRGIEKIELVSIDDAQFKDLGYFELREVKWIDLSQFEPWLDERYELFQTTEELMLVIESVIEKREEFEKADYLKDVISDTIQKTQEGIDSLDDRLSQYQKVFENVPGHGNVSGPPTKMGCNNQTPAKSCWEIKEAFPDKISGFYWLKPRCTIMPIRVYCDFEHEHSQYYFLKETDHLAQPKTVEDVRHLCATQGLWPIKLENSSVQLFLKFVIEMGVDMLQKKVVPIGHDYGCETSDGCSLKFTSFNSEKDPDLTNSLVNMIDRFNILNSEVSIGNEPRDSIGVGMSQTAFLKFQLGKFQTHGVVCSANDKDGWIKPSSPVLTCFDVLKANNDFDGPLGNIFRVMCPKNCAKQLDAKVYGSTVFHEKSSICRAALYLGLIQDTKGGEVQLQTVLNQPEYPSNSFGGIITESCDGMPSDRAFILLDIIFKCPQKNFPDLEESAPSFFQKNIDVSYSKHSRLSAFRKFRLKNVKTLHKKLSVTKIRARIQSKHSKKSKLKNLNENFKSFLQQHKIKSQEQINKELNFKQGQTFNNYTSKASKIQTSFLAEKTGLTYINMLESLIKKKKSQVSQQSTFIQETNEDIESNQEEILKSNQKKVEQSQKLIHRNNIMDKPQETSVHRESFIQQQDDDDDKPEVFTTGDIVNLVKIVFSKNEHALDRNLKLAEDAQALYQIMQNILSPMESTNTSPKVQMIKLEGMTTHLDNTLILSQTLTEKATALRNKIFRAYQLKLIDKIILLKWEPYEEMYFFLLTDLWYVYDDLDAKMGPSNWEFSKDGLKEHDEAMMQNSVIVGVEDIPTIATLKFKSFSDKILDFAFLIKDNASAGAVFRYSDPWNYYYIKISYNEVEFGRMFQGFGFTIVKRKHDLEIDKWYRFQLHVNQAFFKLYRLDEDDPKMKIPNPAFVLENKQPIIEAEDHQHVKGQIGFFTNGCKMALFDKIKLTPVECVIPPPKINRKDVPEDTIYNGPYSNRFYERYHQTIHTNWESMDPKSEWITEQTSDWKFERFIGSREQVIYQANIVNSTGQIKRGTILYLKDKMCVECKFSFEMWMPDENQDQGKIGVVFRLDRKNLINYSMLQFDKKECKILYMKEFNHDLIEKSRLCSIKPNKWYKVLLIISRTDVSLYFNEVGKPSVQIFENAQLPPVESPKFEIGVGLMANATIAAFDKIYFHPPKDPSEHPQTPSIKDEVLIEQESALGKNQQKNLLQDLYYDCSTGASTPESKDLYCRNAFPQPDAQDSVLNCKLNFCTTCCNKKVREFGESPFSICYKKCQDTSVGTTNQSTFDTCLRTGSTPKQSYIQYCNLKFASPTPIEHNRACKQDMCRLCCVYLDDIIKTNLDDEMTNECYQKCMIQLNPKSDNRHLTYIQFDHKSDKINQNFILHHQEFGSKRRRR